MANYKSTIDFIKSVYGNKEFTPLAVPVFAGNEKEYLNECIDTTFVSSVGKFVDRFEEDMAKYTGAKKAVVCVSGTNALHMSLMLAGVERDDEVLTQALTFIATCNALSYIGAHPVFLDVDKTTMGLSPDAMKEWLQANAEIRDNKTATKIDIQSHTEYSTLQYPLEPDTKACYNKTTGRRIKACVPMHTFGHPVRIEEIANLCKEWHIELVEDAAESIGSLYKGQHTGTFGRIGAISFNGNKTITTGGGGMLLFNDEELGKYAKHITTQAKVPHRWEFRHDHIGYNYRMPNINAALGCAQLENLDKYVASKRKVAAEYIEYFKNVDGIDFFAEPENTFSNYWLSAVVLKDKESQLAFLQETNDNGVMTRPIWELMNRLPMFENCQNDGLKNTIYFADRVVNIPSSVRPEDL
ncbi:LegC family aminotransferase [Bacteroides nordii]|uniref:LegC family aminotransferase n=1 Tax=Bacteroides nordii TaxID=291645 RepID=UPI002109AB58|nr:LegC family aminotransferase [Bacteroides nordii]MCQ4913686.1 LegC family aminotransferase [Bacteroides nordii]